MSDTHIKELEAKITELSDLLAKLHSGGTTSKEEFWRIIHGGGWTTPAEFAFTAIVIDAMKSQALSIQSLQRDLLAAARKVNSKVAA
jgi:hypothetical protein